MHIVILICGAFLVLATLLSIVSGPAWWIRIFDFPRQQIAIGFICLIVAEMVFLGQWNVVDYAFLGAFVAGIAYQSVRIFPFTPLASRQVQDTVSRDDNRSLRLLIANVLMHNRRAEDFLALVREYKPDLVLAVETDAWWDHQLEPLRQTYPHVVTCPLPNTYGMHLSSRLELGSPVLRFLVEDDVPSVRTGVRLRSGDWIDFYGVHPRPPTPGQDTEQRDAELLLVGKEVKARARPAIVAGDLNDVAWSHTTRLFQRISGLLDPRVGRGMFGTFHASYPFFRWPLDHVFHDRSFRIAALQRLPWFGSDHFPVFMELRYEPQNTSNEMPERADAEDRREIETRIQEGLEAGSGAGRSPMPT
ncbi:MAG: endonuclease/exonuclease/phosphatase family protein [Acetobacteraceae bacterium]